MKLNAILSQLLMARTAEEIAAASLVVNAYRANAGAAEKEAINAVVDAKATAIAKEARMLYANRTHKGIIRVHRGENFEPGRMAYCQGLLPALWH